MNSVVRQLRVAGVVVCLALLATACRVGSTAAGPSIDFTTVPIADEGGPDRTAVIAGRVTGARPGQRIVIFAKSNIWWVQPLADRPFTDVAADATWQATIHLGTEYAALLVDPAYRPPPTLDVLPEPGGLVLAVRSVKGTGDLAARVLERLIFSGYEWEVRETRSDRGGPNDFDPANAWVDGDGHLHLKMAQREGKWTGAEVRLRRPLGYGTYVFVVRDVSRLESAAVFSLFTWDADAAAQTHREMGIEISRWGDPALKNAQFVVQPFYMPANVSRFAAPTGRMTHTLRWEPGRATFTTVAGGGLAQGRSIARHEFAAGVPSPGNETVHMNLYQFRYVGVPLTRDVEVVIEKFQFLP